MDRDVERGCGEEKKRRKKRGDGVLIVRTQG